MTGGASPARTLLVAVMAAVVGCGGGKPTAPVADPPAVPRDPPRLVVLYVFDALRADHLGGRGWTPFLDRVAAEGAVFTDHTSTAVSTMTWAKTMFSGRFFFEKGGLPDTEETLAEVIRAAGYRALGLSGNGHVSAKYGLDRGFDVLEMVWPLARGADPDTYVNRNAADLHRRALELIDEDPSNHPTFLYIHSIHPHTPYAPPHELADALCGGIPSSIDGMSPTLLAIRDGDIVPSADDRRRLACLYAVGLRYADAELGRFLAGLEARVAAEDTLLIVTSDHGEELFDHGGVLHGHTLYDELLRVPLVIRWPGTITPSVVDAAVDTVDLHETLRALVGAPPSAAGAGGRSLWPALLGDPATLGVEKLRFAVVPTLPGGMTMVRSDRHKLVFAPRTDGGPGMGLGPGRSHDPEYLFDLWEDPGETTNLIGLGLPEEARLRAALIGWAERTAAGGSAAPVELDRETREHLEALGYVD